MNYTWTAPSTGNVLNPNSQNTSVQGAGIYTLTVKHPISFCLFSAQAEVLEIVKTPTILTGINPTITCLSPSVSLTSSVSPTDALVNWKGINVCGTSTDVSTYACAAGIYTVTATDVESNCVTTKTLQVFSNELAPVISVNQYSNAITCTNTLVAVSATSSLTSLTYTWSGVGILSGANSPTVTVSQGGLYTYSVTNNDNGCANSATVAVTQNTATPFTNIVVKGILSCSSSTVSLTAFNPNLTYTWTPPSSVTLSQTNTQTISVNSGGIYSLTVTSPTNGCIYTTTASVTQYTTVPTSSISISGTLTCLSNSVNLTSSLSGMNYTWTAPSTGNVLNPNSQNTSVQGAGIYTLTVKHPISFCLFSTQAEVLENVKTPTIVTGINPTITCLSPSVSLTSSISPTDAIINWKGINVCGTSTNVSTYACSAGIYTLTATDAESNCVSTKTLQVFSNKIAPVISVNQYSNTLTCTHTVIVTSLTSTLTTLTYTWSGIGITSGIHTPTVTIIQGGTYNYSVTDTDNGCIASGSLAIQQNTATPVTIASVNGTLTCSTSTVNLLSTVPNLSYTWSAPPTASLTNTGTQNTIGNTAGIYTLTVKNPTTACFYVTTTEVFENIITPTISALSHQTITCSSPSVTLTGSVSPSNSIIKWYGPTICGTNTTTSTFGCSPGIYSLTATHPINSCASSATLEVFSNKESITVTVNPPTHSLTCTHTLVTVSIKSITPSYTYTWSGPGILGGTNSPTVSVNESGTYSYSVTDTNNGCGGTGTVSVAQNTVIPTTTISVNGTLTCVTSSISLTSSLANTSYTWSAPSTSISITNENLQDIIISHPGTYSLVVEDITNGCHFATTANVLQDTITPITNIISSGTITCANPTVTLNSNLAGMSYTWTSESDMNVSNSQNTIVNQSGTYTLTVLNTLNGCTYKAFVDAIENKHRPDSSFSANPTSGIVPLDVNFTPLNPTSNNDYSWNFGDNYQNTSSSQNPSHVYNDLKTYIVTLDVTDKTSLCQTTNTLAITVYEQPSIIVPNVFTANDDGANDIYKIITKGIVELNMDIYNRWGTKIFSFTGVNDYWDGAESPAGTYFYILSAIGIDDKTYQQQGFITLFK
jgi:gliding motility-associated-like protein